MYRALYLSPMVPSSNIRETVSFFVRLFQFKIGLDDPTYVILYRDNLTIHISQSDSHINELEFYLEVDNLDELWNSIKDKMNGIRIKEPFNQDYGMREFHIAVPHTKTVMFVGQEIEKNS